MRAEHAISDLHCFFDLPSREGTLHVLPSKSHARRDMDLNCRLGEDIQSKPDQTFGAKLLAGQESTAVSKLRFDRTADQKRSPTSADSQNDAGTQCDADMVSDADRQSETDMQSDADRQSDADSQNDVDNVLEFRSLEQGKGQATLLVLRSTSPDQAVRLVLLHDFGYKKYWTDDVRTVIAEAPEDCRFAVESHADEDHSSGWSEVEDLFPRTKLCGTVADKTIKKAGWTMVDGHANDAKGKDFKRIPFELRAHDWVFRVYVPNRRCAKAKNFHCIPLMIQHTYADGRTLRAVIAADLPEAELLPLMSDFFGHKPFHLDIFSVSHHGSDVGALDKIWPSNCYLVQGYPCQTDSSNKRSHNALVQRCLAAKPDAKLYFTSYKGDTPKTIRCVSRAAVPATDRSAYNDRVIRRGVADGNAELIFTSYTRITGVAANEGAQEQPPVAAAHERRPGAEEQPPAAAAHERSPAAAPEQEQRPGANEDKVRIYARLAKRAYNTIAAILDGRGQFKGEDYTALRLTTAQWAAARAVPRGTGFKMRMLESVRESAGVHV